MRRIPALPGIKKKVALPRPISYTALAIGLLWWEIGVGEKTPLNQFLRNLKDLIYPNRVAQRMTAHPALRAKMFDFAGIARGLSTEDTPKFEGRVFTGGTGWFSAYDWRNCFGATAHDVKEYLEIGSFEGRSTITASEMFPNAHLTCIDTFGGGDEHSEDVVNGLEARFLHNVEPFKDRVTALKGRSLDRLVELQANVEAYDVMFIDGSHFYRDVALDTLLCWPLLKVGGVLIWDDYFWKLPHTTVLSPSPPSINFCRHIVETTRCCSLAVRWGSGKPSRKRIVTADEIACGGIEIRQGLTAEGRHGWADRLGMCLDPL